MDKDYAQYLLEKTIENYNLIAEDFSRTRHNSWPGFEVLAQYSKSGDKVLDLGCGNGRLLDLLRDKSINYIGIDNSSTLISLAQKRYPGVDFRVGDALNLPFPDNYFDKIYSIAVLHHIPSKELRQKFLAEAKRVLKPKGRLILTVWDLKQKRQLRFKFFLKKIVGLSKLDFGDLFVPWAKKYQRYIHCFTVRELAKLAQKTNFKIEKAGKLKMGGGCASNIFIVALKP